MAEKLDLAI